MGIMGIERKYELVVILDARLSNDDKDDIIKTIIELVKKYDGKVINSQVWIEKQKFAFEIKKCKEGIYYIINISTKASSISKMRSILKLEEKILRFEFIKLDPRKKVEVVKKMESVKKVEAVKE